MKLTHQLERDTPRTARKYPIEVSPRRHANDRSPALLSKSSGRLQAPPSIHHYRSSRMQIQPELPSGASLSPIRVKEVIFVQRSSVSPIRKRIIEASQSINPELLQLLDNHFVTFQEEVRRRFSHLNSRAENLTKYDASTLQHSRAVDARARFEGPIPDNYIRKELPTRRREQQVKVSTKHVHYNTVTEPSPDSPLKPHNLSFAKKEEEPKELNHSVATTHRKGFQSQEPSTNQEPTARKADRQMEAGSIIRRIDSDKDLQRYKQAQKESNPRDKPPTQSNPDPSND